MENAENKPFFWKFLRSFLKLTILCGLILLFFWINVKKIIEDKIYQYLSKQQAQTEEAWLPLPGDPKEMIYEWKYNGQSYAIKEILYGSFYDFYASLPETYSYYDEELPQNWEEEYFNMFLRHPAEDKTISELAAKIKELGIKNKLSDDRIVELTLSFVQNIPYDEAKAKRILSESRIDQSKNTGDTPDYPYETLYKKTGVCSDKSLLAYSLIREMGYGVAIFVYEAENHMSIGIKCPQNYSAYDSGYCYVETTSPGNKIGIIPELDITNNNASSAKEIEYFNDNENAPSNSKTIGAAKIINTSDGKAYGGIIQTIATQQNIAELKTFLNKEKVALSSIKISLKENQDAVADLKDEMDKLLSKENYSEYNNLVPKYNGQIKDYQKDLKVYNKRIEIYNQKVNEYNKLIKSFYQI